MKVDVIVGYQTPALSGKASDHRNSDRHDPALPIPSELALS